MWTGLFNLSPSPEGSASTPHNIVLNQNPRLQTHPWHVQPKYVCSGYFLLLWITVTSWRTLRTGSIAQQYPHVKDNKCIQVVCNYNVKIAKRLHFFFQECSGKIADQILLLGPSDTNLSSGGILWLWLVDLQVASHHTDSRQWGGKRRRIKTTNKMPSPPKKKASSTWRRQAVF